MGSGEQIVAGWVLERRLGSGGYGEVWRARRRHVDLVRALKLIPIVDDTTFESWRHEIGRLEALNHPNVVRFYDADIVSEGQYSDYAWIATELCERSLSDQLRTCEGHVLPWTDGEKLLDAMLAALAAAHAAGMVHRDIKPANILQHRDGTWKLCDFGTARLVPSDATHPVTRVIGTSPYMSPGAHRGQQNHAADLYGLAVTVHEALCGERLHRRPDGVTDSEYIKLVLDTPPSVSTELPHRWQTVVAALIGNHGTLDAAQLREWFTTTRGDRPPNGTAAPVQLAQVVRVLDEPPKVAAQHRPRPLPVGAGPVVVTGPMAPRRNGRNGRRRIGSGTGPTEHRIDAKQTAKTLVRALKGPVVDPSPTSAPPPQVHIPAPDPASPPAAARSSRGRATPPVPPAGPATPDKPKPPSPPLAPPPIQPYGYWPGARPPWMSVTVDPTAVTGRRAVAFVVDGFVVLLMTAVFFLAAVVTQYDRVAVPAEARGLAGACDVLDDQFADCVVVGTEVYVSSSGSVVKPNGFATVAILLVLVLLQGLTGATPGKLLCGIRVVGPDGRRPGLLRAFVRTVLWAVDGFPWVVPLLGWLLAANTKGHRRLGDMVARTYVVRRR